MTRECFPSLKAAPELISTPDVPIPFAPELETACRPSQEKIRNDDYGDFGSRAVAKGRLKV